MLEPAALHFICASAAGFFFLPPEALTLTQDGGVVFRAYF
jgi:hypothetical protein